jgi:hypothetical protein
MHVSRAYLAYFSGIVLVCATLPCLSHAQLSSASVTGVVRDTTGGVIADAAIVLRNIDTSVERRASSNSAGNYAFVNVPVGKYVVDITKPGFRNYRVADLVLEVDHTATIDASLSLGGVEQTVQVEAAADLIQASSAELGAVVTQKQVTDLPLNGRNFTQLLTLTPGAAPVNGPQQSNGFGNTALNTAYSFPAINGQTNRSNFFMLDGLNNQGAFASTYVVPPIVDGIQEFKINSHDDQAEFGGVLGGIVNVVTKSGTNELHGAAWEFVRNTDFNARNTFQPAVTPFHQNQFGVTVGGPVIVPKLYNGRNKTFFFFGYEGFRYSQANNAFLRVPTNQELAGNFNGPNEPAQIFNPFTTLADPANPGAFIRDPFPNNQIPTSLISQPLVNYVHSLIPQPNYSGTSDRNAIDNTPQIQNQNEYTGRIDQTFGAKNFLWFRYSVITLDQTLPGGLPNLTNNKNNPGQNWGASYVHTFSSSFILQAQFGRAHQETNGLQRWLNAPANTLQNLGISPNFVSNFIDGSSFIPSLSVSNFFGAGENNSLNPNETNIFQYKAAVTKILGSHTFKFGGEWNSTNFESFYENNSITFNTPQTSNPANPSQVGSALASFLLGVPDAASRRNVHETTRPGGVMSFFFQDSWKATPKLTVNIGLRYDRTFLPPYGKENTVGMQGGIETGDMNFNDGTYVLQKVPPSCVSRGYAPCIPTPDGGLPAHVVVDPRGKIYHDTTTNWGPHLGLAYRLNDKTVLRGSFAIFYDNWAAVLQSAQNFEGSWPDVGQQIANNLNNPVPGQPTPNITYQNPFPSGLFPAATPFNQVQWFADPYAKNPYSMQWNGGIQHQFNQSTALTVNFVGSGSRRLDVGGYYNTALTPGPGNPQDRALYPYIHPTNYDRSWGLGEYDGLQVLLNRRFSAGLAFQFAYTYSKAIDTGASDWYGNGTAIQDPYHYRNDRGPSLFDLPHVFSANILYELPVGTGKRFKTGNKAFDYVIGNWQVNTITTARNGNVFNVTVNGDIANTGNNSGYERANLVGNPSLPNPNRQAFINRAAFAIPAIYTFGNLGRNRLRTDNFWNVDASIFRQFPFLESRKVEFRAEAFNAVNNVIFAAPSSNLSNANFGQVTGTANNSRTLQLGLKVLF